jgi:WD40 repeat protein
MSALLSMVRANTLIVLLFFLLGSYDQAQNNSPASNNLNLSDDPVITSIAWSTEGNTLAFSTGNTISLYDVDNAHVEDTLFSHSEEPILLILFSNNEQTLTTLDSVGTIRIWDLNTGNQQSVFEDKYSFLADMVWPENGNLTVAEFRPGNIDIRMPLLETDIPVSYDFQGSTIQDLAFSPDGSSLLVIGAPTMLSTSQHIWIFETLTGILINEIINKNGSTMIGMFLNMACYSPDGDFVAIGGEQVGGAGSIWLWDPINGNLMNEFQNLASDIKDLTISPLGDFIATADMDGTIKIWHLNDDTISNEAVHILPDNGQIIILAFSQDQRFLASLNVEGRVKIWDVQTGQQNSVLP